MEKHTDKDKDGVSNMTGRTLHSPIRYDFQLWLAFRGREKNVRDSVLDLLTIKAGDSVLDAGCGTGTLAIAAKRLVGPTGSVHGIDASPEMIARAEKKAQKARVTVAFKYGFVQSLPFPEAHFDVVLSTMMLHHMPHKGRREFIFETRRVLKQGGRLLVVDFIENPRKKKGFFSRFHRHGHINFSDTMDVLNEAGLQIVENGETGIYDLRFVLATARDRT